MFCFGFFPLQVSKLGFGCMGLTGIYNSPLSEEDGVQIIVDAFKKGITFFDTANVYGANANEIMVGKVWSLLWAQKIAFDNWYSFPL